MRLQPLFRQHRRLFSRFHPLPLLQAALCLLCITVKTAQAADAAWVGGIGTQNWSDGANWNPAAAPGAISGTTNANIATFNTGLGATTITVDAGRNLRSLVFATGAAGSFTIGSAGTNAGETLHLSSGGTVVMNSGITAPVTVNAPIVVHPTSGTGTGTYTFANNATSANDDANAHKMIINGNVSGGDDVQHDHSQFQCHLRQPQQ
jgi:hypothetical protein